MGYCCLSVFAQPGGDEPEETFTYSIAYTGDLFYNVSGGVDTGARFLGNFDADVSIDLEALAGIKGGDLFFYGLGNHGRSISALAGDLQGVSNIEAENSWRLYEAWYRQSIPSLRSSVLVGLYDVNSEFDVTKTALLFINSSHGIGAAYGNSGVLGPSIFPYTSMGVRFKINPMDGLTIKTAVLDGVPSDPGNTKGTKIYLRERDGVLFASEVSYATGGDGVNPSRTHTYLQRGVRPLEKTRLSAGAWLYTTDRTGWNGTEERDYGMYGMMESVLYREHGQGQGLAGFIRAGIANNDVNPFKGYLGSGLVYTGLFEGRNEDQLGLAIAWAPISDGFQRISEMSGTLLPQFELNMEVTYLLALSSRVQAQADIQYVINPGSDRSLNNAFIPGLRMVLAL